ncbi:MAG: ABC transporter ATP-binding protein [Myxococcales bacterium]|nr:ABC transporter ATP-binding protein [Myxococcales bacterium]
MTDLLRLSSVEKRFGGLRAVGGVSFDVPEGGIFGLIGPNGAGKTTVFNLITGVYQADQGTIRLADRELVGLQPAQIAAAGVARTFQNIRLFASMTVLENVLVAGELRRRSHFLGEIARSKIAREDEELVRTRAAELLAAMGLAGQEEAMATSLPYGSQRRLEIARALMLAPKLLLLDEPAAGLNYGEAETLKEQIRSLRDRYELTVVLVEHNMQVVMGVCERIHVLDHGITLAEGTPAEIKSHPKVIAAYLGEDLDEAEAEA